MKLLNVKYEDDIVVIGDTPEKGAAIRVRPQSRTRVQLVISSKLPISLDHTGLYPPAFAPGLGRGARKPT